MVKKAFPDLPDHVTTLLSLCRKRGIEVVWLHEGTNPRDSPNYAFWQRMNHGKNATVDPWAEEDFAMVEKGEQVFVKYGYDGVGVDCGLEGYLYRGGTRKVLVCGLLTSACVHLTAAGLFNRGYEVCIVRDCCGDRTRGIHDHHLTIETRRTYAVVNLEDVQRVAQEGPGSDLARFAELQYARLKV